jgi:uncharacterized membrane protein YbhN (UPF0104 family)
LETLPRFTLAASLSMVLGFVMMIPAGAGVRDFAMAQVLITFFVALLVQQNPAMSLEEVQKIASLQAILVAAVQRGISILTELAVSAAFFKKFLFNTENAEDTEKEKL